MSPDDNTIPEEKLLNLIRRSNKKGAKHKPPDAYGAFKQIKSPEPITPVKGESVSGQGGLLFSGIKSLNFVFINKLILFVALAVFLFLLFDALYRSPRFSDLEKISGPQAGIVSAKSEEAKPFSYYQQEISRRQLFSPAQEGLGVKKVIPAGPAFKELIKELKLLGIVSGESSRAVIEDEKLRKTYFLYAGDYIGEIRVEEILSDRVVLELNEERINLFL